ncbi:MAG TPA: type II toxin-antitoxin system VapC family toxin [Solirubrobacterales bacterium]|nr:type II toxin-antitoxin system VapC family toxin [Solirubrobacterales bacterium]
MKARVVLDASAALAALLDESGGEEALRQLSGAAMSTANWAEVVERAISAGLPAEGLRGDFEGMGVRLVPLDADQAECAARLRQPTRAAGLSLADRICLSLGLAEGLPVLTADRAWTDLDLGVEVRLVR